MTIGLGTAVPGFFLWKCFYNTGAVEAERGAKEELARHRADALSRAQGAAITAEAASSSSRSNSTTFSFPGGPAADMAQDASAVGGSVVEQADQRHA
eukprot:CAMPEP_0117474874 /NCGR_PEP_ID=MMETSP0784-20121206/9505_1 /TAXON_ID=39447 /ORGANISM="" /LENGTH=96 /DNA_ID=CAMNT_0005269105 /DNA_START=129 /DNA_END=420 /DNA_ORIENTATION=-